MRKEKRGDYLGEKGRRRGRKGRREAERAIFLSTRRILSHVAVCQPDQNKADTRRRCVAKPHSYNIYIGHNSVFEFVQTILFGETF